MAEWFSIEVLDGSIPARPWVEGRGDRIIEAALWHGATEWHWHWTPWGVVLELELPDEVAWENFKTETIVQAALDAVPDPVNGVMLYRGRGGSSGVRDPKRPRPLSGAGSAELPLPHPGII